MRNVDVDVFAKVPTVVGGASNKGLDKVNAEEAEEVYEGGEERDNGSQFGESDDVEGHGVADLVSPPEQQIVRHRKEKSEENGVGQVKRERECI